MYHQSQEQIALKKPLFRRELARNHVLTPNALLASVHATSAPRAHILAAFEINGSQTKRIRTEERTPVAGGANRLSHRVHLRAASPLGRSPRQTEAVAVVAWPAGTAAERGGACVL